MYLNVPRSVSGLLKHDLATEESLPLVVKQVKFADGILTPSLERLLRQLLRFGVLSAEGKVDLQMGLPRKKPDRERFHRLAKKAGFAIDYEGEEYIDYELPLATLVPD
jgi:hypothetical protein